jgi:three-Cys-motif partner protein
MTRSAHFWTADKLDFLEAYIPAFVSATKRAKARYYVDGFAGPGRNSIEGQERDGSPLIALNAREACTHYFFVERKKSLYKQLLGYVHEHSRAKQVALRQGDFNQLVDSILPNVPDLAPCLFFLDPEGLELDFTTVEKIARRTKVDLFVLISGFGLVRNIRRPEASATLTRFFGDDSWMPLLERFENGNLPRGTKAFEAFTDLYITKLQHIGFAVCDKYLIARNRKNAALHSLVFAIKSDKPQAALSIAPDILDKLQRKNQQRLDFF